MNDLISVIVPVYNAEKYLDRCILSIVRQTYKNIEIILINDGSTDNSGLILDNWRNKDGRIKVINKQNEGVLKTRNKAIEISKGDYIIMIDNDDYMEPDMIEYLYNLLVSNNADISRCGFWFEFENETSCAVNNQEIIVLEYKDFEKKIIDLVMSDHSSGVLWNKLYKREIITNIRFEDEDGSADDFLFNYRVLKLNPKLVISNTPKHHYLIRENSITNSKFGDGAFSIIRAKQILLNDFKNNERIYPYLVKSYVVSAFIVLTGCIKNNYFNRYDELRASVINLYPIIKHNSLFSFQEKLKVFTVYHFPKTYKFLIRKKYHV